MTVYYDPRCEELARHFLADEPGITDAVVQELAGVIQRAIEDWWATPEDKRGGAS
jgi:hypothetical protein